MRWTRTKKKTPASGDRRVVRRFLFLPRRLPRRDGVPEWRWLESALVEQRYREVPPDQWSPILLAHNLALILWEGWESVRWADEAAPPGEARP